MLRDPTEYEYSATMGLMTKVKYWTGAEHYDANYNYDGLGRVTKLTDWIDATDGLRYGYDAGGRLTTSLSVSREARDTWRRRARSLPASRARTTTIRC